MLRVELSETSIAGAKLARSIIVAKTTNLSAVNALIYLVRDRGLSSREVKQRINFEILTRRNSGALGAVRKVRLMLRDLTAALKNINNPTS